jgi:hypothetical protein
LISFLAIRAMLGFAFGNLKHDLGLLWKWLCHRSFWQLTTMAACLYIGVQYFELRHERSVSTDYRKQRDGYKAQLDKISTAKNDQAAVTKDRIVTVTRIVHDAEGRAKVVESAPLLGSCKTPPAIMGADL